MQSRSNCSDPKLIEDGRAEEQAARPIPANENLAAHRAYRHLRARIQNGWTPENGRIREAAIARELKISRTPVREAIRQLERDGILRVRPNCGASLNIPSQKEVDELYEVRLLLECQAAAGAAANAAPQDVAILRQHVSDMLDTARRVRAAGLSRMEGELDDCWLRADLGFHAHVIRMAGNSWIEKILGNLQITDRIVRYNRSRPASNLISRLAQACLNHYRILKAIERKDAAAAGKHMSAGLQRAREEMRQVESHNEKEAPYAKE